MGFTQKSKKVTKTAKDIEQDKEITRLKRMLKPEIKYLDHFIGVTTISTSNWLSLGTNGNNITASTQGLTVNDRIGNQISVRHITVKFLLFQPALVTTTLTLSEMPAVRIVLFVNKQTNQATTNYLQMWSGVADMNNLRNRNNKNFTFLHDKIYQMPSPSITHSDNAGGDNLIVGRKRKLFEIKHAFRTPLKILANNTTNVIGSYNDNTIGIAINSSSTTLQYSYQARVLYTDA